MDLLVQILLVCSFLVWHNGAESELSKEDDFKIERQVKLLNKPAIKTIKTQYGDLYDCVDFFKQPAFDHPLLRNGTSDFQVIPPSILNIIKSHRLKKAKEVNSIGLEDLECPVGTVPIRRVTKSDLVKDYLASKASSSETSRTHFAVLKTTSTKGYSGAGAFLSIHNPKVNSGQYTAARLRITNGPDVIQAGWRVDPSLYDDTKTRLFVRTDNSGPTHCFNTRCPGYVIVRHDFPPDGILSKISVRGGPRYSIKLFIIRDEHGNWNLQAGPDNIIVGYWPARLFTGLSGLASFLEWGAEVYTPPNSLFPPMGEGKPSLVYNTDYDAYFRQVSEFNELGQLTDPTNLQQDVDGFMYKMSDEGVIDEDDFKHLMIYGGAGGKEVNDTQI